MICHRIALSTFFTATVLAALGLPARAQDDQVKVYSESKRIQGKVESITRNEVVVNTQTGARTIPSNDVAMIFFSSQSNALRLAQVALDKGDLKEAMQQLGTIRTDDFDRDLLKAEVAFMKAVVPAKIALSGQTDEDSGENDPAAAAKQAGTLLKAFLAAYPTSCHYYEANETMGDLAMSVGSYGYAAECYQKLTESPAAEVKARAHLLRGRAMQTEGKYDKALEAYDTVLKSNLKGKVGEQEMIEAKVGRTYSLAGSGKVDEAITTLKEIIAKAEDDESELLARAYDALGNCYRKQNKNKEALWAYLRVDMLYKTVPEAHAEALANLVDLWKEAKQNDRAREARDYLQQHYPFSRWNRK